MRLKPIKPGTRISLTDGSADAEAEASGEEAVLQLARLHERLETLQVALYAESKQALLIVLQGRDAAGKDGVIRKVFGPLNSQGCVVTSFKRPTEHELSHDYLWRIHQAIPPRGTIGIFNRSHYEDVLPVRVHELVPKSVWSKRYQQINDFERMLTESGVAILKFFLHVSKAEQKKRLLERLNDPMKNWKFQVGDVDERKRWSDYTRAYEDVLGRTSTAWAPWYLVPADRKKSRDVFIAHAVAEKLERMGPKFPHVAPGVLERAREWERDGDSVPKGKRQSR